MTMPTHASNSALQFIRPRICALLMAGLLFVEAPLPLQAQLAAAPPKGLQVMILDGEGALNNIHERTAREPIVQVQDENHKPVAGALVLFTVHGGSEGASATFSNGLTTLSVTTDAEGKAVARGLQANQTSGAWQVAVTATMGPLTATAVINENNVAPPSAPAQQTSIAPAAPAPPVRWFMQKPIMILGGAIVAGAVITVVAIKANQGTTINVGTTTVGAPALVPGVRFNFHLK
jgi:hypothetical protein